MHFGEHELITTADKLQEAIGYTDRKFGNLDLEDIKRYIEKNMHVMKVGGGRGKSKRFKFHIVSNYIPDDATEAENETVNKQLIVGNGRPYVFEAKNFLTTTEYYDLFPDERPEVLAARTDTQQRFEEDVFFTTPATS